MKLLSLFARAAIVAASVAALPAMAGVISFDEFAPDNVNGGLPADRYAALGVTFDTDDDGSTWGGVGNGDPGNWDLEGTNGSVFSGYNGTSFSARLFFDSAVTGVALDVASGNGVAPGAKFRLTGYLGGVLAGTSDVVLSSTNVWLTASLGGPVDELRWRLTEGQVAYGMDNIRWTDASVVPEPASLALAGIALGLLGAVARRRQA